MVSGVKPELTAEAANAAREDLEGSCGEFLGLMLSFYRFLLTL
jgi:hypothetical protein